MKLLSCLLVLLLIAGMLPPLGLRYALAQSYYPLRPQSLSNVSVAVGGTAVIVLTPTTHLNGGWLQNCPSNAGTTLLFVNDSATAGTTPSGGNAQLVPGQIYNVPPGNTYITVNSLTAGAAICGEGYN